MIPKRNDVFAVVIQTMEFLTRYRFFLGLFFCLFLLNLLVTNDFISIWEQVEYGLLSYAQDQTVGELVLPIATSAKIGVLYEIFGLELFFLRLPSLMLLGFSMVLFYLFGRKIFGQEASLLTLVVLASSFLVVNISKFVGSDTWLFCAQWLNFVFLILSLKQPILKWQIPYAATVLLGCMTHPISMFVWVLISLVYLVIFHPKGKQLRKTALFALGGIAISFLCWKGQFFTLQLDSFLLAYKSSSIKDFTLLHLFGMAPWSGFLAAAFWDLFKKIRKGEELAIIIMAGLLAGLGSFSMTLQAVFAFMIAKQLMVYLAPNYPHGNIVKTVSIITMIIAFCVATVLMLTGFQEYRGVGFRSAMAIGMVFWISGIVGLIGLFLRDQKYIIGGMAMSGLLTTLLFWLQLYPIIETNRNFTKQIVKEASAISKNKKTIVVNSAALEKSKSFQLYAKAAFEEIDYSTATLGKENTTYILDSLSYAKVGTNIDKQNINEIKGKFGWKEQPQQFWLLYNK